MESNQIRKIIREKINQKTKPQQSLGQLEYLAEKIALYQATEEPKLVNPEIMVFAGDHGVSRKGVSAYPQEVTYQMVLNFIRGGAAINVFTQQHDIQLSVVDTGVIGQFDSSSSVIDCKVAEGTADFTEQAAMTDEQYQQCFTQAQNLVRQKAEKGCNVIGFGEMGIGNTAASSLIMHNLTDLPLSQCVGRGTGVDDAQFEHKLRIVEQANRFHGRLTQIEDILKAYAGFEIIHLTAAMLAAFEHKMLILIDGFISTTAFAAAQAIRPGIESAAIFCHQSDELGHQYLLTYLNAKPILQMSLRLGEGTGCALAYPIVQSAINFINQMASFESANVSQKIILTQSQ